MPHLFMEANEHIQVFVVYIVGKMAQDVGNVLKVLWCHSHLVWLVFEGFIPTCSFFFQKTFL